MQTLKYRSDRPNRRTTLADVARAAGVSIATVSRVLNNKTNIPIAPATIRKIREAATRLEYHPNLIARALATQRTSTIALFTKEMVDPHFVQMIQPVEAALRKRGYHLALCSETAGVLAEGRVDGAILLANPNAREDLFKGLSLPVIYVWGGPGPCPGCVSWDDAEGMAMAVRYLVNLGHRRIAGLFGDYPDNGSRSPKVEGYRRAISQAGYEPNDWFGCFTDDQFENGYLITRQRLAGRRDWTAIVARNDYLALGALRALREAGVSVPEQVSVVGYNDTEMARFADPPLTSVLTPIAEAGALAAIHLVDSIENRRTSVQGMGLPMTITERMSCAIAER
ncbi:MAG: LacI family DNA-binding transcriptional regulator [Chthonomonadales bacterium]|nr:LacI family DNA-binding transcriptional regulator [Chthonomonadales bacterium]